MKLFLSLMTFLLLNQNVFATGATGEDPNAEKISTNESGTVITAAVASGSQAKACAACMTPGTAHLGNSIGVLNSVNASSVGSPSPTTPAKSGQ